MLFCSYNFLGLVISTGLYYLEINLFNVHIDDIIHSLICQYYRNVMQHIYYSSIQVSWDTKSFRPHYAQMDLIIFIFMQWISGTIISTTPTIKSEVFFPVK